MKKENKFNNKKYILEKDEENLFDYNVVKELVTTYFNSFDYIFIDQAYNKLRLKGFNDKDNKNFKKSNDIKTLDDYLKNYCAYKCKWCKLKKIK